MSSVFAHAFVNIIAVNKGTDNRLYLSGGGGASTMNVSKINILCVNEIGCFGLWLLGMIHSIPQDNQFSWDGMLWWFTSLATPKTYNFCKYIIYKARYYYSCFSLHIYHFSLPWTRINLPLCLIRSLLLFLLLLFGKWSAITVLSHDLEPQIVATIYLFLFFSSHTFQLVVFFVCQF